MVKNRSKAKTVRFQIEDGVYIWKCTFLKITPLYNLFSNEKITFIISMTADSKMT